MSKINIILLFLITFLFAVSCKNETPSGYSFFVAGHTYGKPGTDQLGFYPIFKKEFVAIRSYPKISFGVLTGDIVQHGTKESWDIIDDEINELGLPVYFAPGNHDTYNNRLYRKRYGDREYGNRTYGYFLKNGDLFILLDANIDKWSISGYQLKFLKNILVENKDLVNNVFVFVHQIIWWDEYTKYKNIKHNWPPYTPDTTNYWGTLEPLFQNYAAPVYLFAGDLGATKNATPYMYHKDDNINYIGGGMGSGINDNYLFVTIDALGSVKFDLIALQGARNRFGRLEDYVLP